MTWTRSVPRSASPFADLLEAEPVETAAHDDQDTAMAVRGQGIEDSAPRPIGRGLVVPDRFRRTDRWPRGPLGQGSAVAAWASGIPRPAAVLLAVPSVAVEKAQPGPGPAAAAVPAVVTS